jgi:hypothetical protein
MFLQHVLFSDQINNSYFILTRYSMKLVNFSSCSQFKMKALTFTVFSLIILVQTSCQNISSRNSLVSHAINGMLQDYFAKTSPKIDLIHVNDGKSEQSEKLIKSILKNKDGSLLFKVSTHSDYNSTIMLNTSSVIIFDSAESFRKMRNNIFWQPNYAVRYKHLVYFPKGRRSDLELIQFNLMFKFKEEENFERRLDEFSIDRVNFLMNETDQSIELVSGFMFTSQACRKNQFLTINRFERSSMKWNSSIFYPNKYRNLYQCELDYYRTAYILPNEILDAFIKFVNSTPVDLSQLTVEGDNRTGDLAATITSLNNKVAEWSSVSNPYGFGQMVFLIPPGDLYTPLEKMMAPFETEVWIGIAATLVIGFVIVQLVNFADTQVKKFVLGRSITTPAMNLVSIFLNGSQVKTAGRNFARFIFILFVIWCFVIRTCYQSKLFESLQSDKRKPEIKTIDELLEKNFAFCNDLHFYFFKMDNERFKSARNLSSE